MADLPGSPLPREPEYWDGLARRIAADAAAPLARYAASGSWYDLLANRAPWLVAAAALAIAALLLTMPRGANEAAYLWIERSLAPDETAGSLLSSSSPPSIDVMLAQFLPPGTEPEVH